MRPFGSAWPGWVFGPVWTVLYATMGVSAWMVWRRRGFGGAGLALGLYLFQLALNALWTRLSLSGAIAVTGRSLQTAWRLPKDQADAWLVSELARQKLDKPGSRVCPRAIKSKRSKFQTRPRGSPCKSYPRFTLKLKRP